MITFILLVMLNLHPHYATVGGFHRADVPTGYATCIITTGAQGDLYANYCSI
jgi:hypothetical protein